MWNSILDPAIGYWSGELFNRTKGGKDIPVFLTITPFRSATGKVVGYMGIALDISKQKELETEVYRQDRLASVGMLVSGLAHEIGNPLGTIRGRAELLKMRPDQDSFTQKGLDVIITQADRISTLIRSLLRFGRGTKKEPLKPVRVIAVAEEVISLIGQYCKENEIELQLNVPEQIEVFADFNRLQQIMMNFLMNSIHAIREAVKLGISNERKIFIQTQINKKTTGDRIAISVRDTGCGMTPENQKKLFQPFFSTKDVGRGTGLGLATCSGLINEMDGEISVESKWGEGSTFTVYLKQVIV